jgi:diguanylate cyclase (GGDEF)-like protein
MLKSNPLMAIYLPISLLLLQVAVLAFVPSITGPFAYLTMVAAPLLTAIAAVWRARRETPASRVGWYAIALALSIWALGALGNLWQEWVLGQVAEMYRSSMLAFNLATVPIAYLLASEWRPGGRRVVRVIDAALAFALGYVYFLVTWTMIAERAKPEEVGVAYLVWLIDAQNLFLTVGAFVRWGAAEDRAERDLFRAFAIYSAALFTLVFINDHYFAGRPELGPEYGSIITIAFALLSGFALSGPSSQEPRRVRLGLVRAVRTASPIVLCGALLVVSLFLIRVDYVYGCAGILIAAVGYGARSTLTQVRYIERSDTLQQQRSELQAIARTDALTGVANRYWLDQELRSACRGRGAGHSLSLLMIDVDHFKLLNDQVGHVAGDTCLRGVARALQSTLLRPDDLLARYGGEEFVALLRGVDAEGAQIVAQRMCTAVRDLRIENGGSPLGVVTVSIGAATTMLNAPSDPQQLIEAADRALYRAKCAGRNQMQSAAATA